MLLTKTLKTALLKLCDVGQCIGNINSTVELSSNTSNKIHPPEAVYAFV